MDSGAAVTAIPPEPGDVHKPELALKAANNTRIKCYGFKILDIQIGRKRYAIQAAIADVNQPIIGFDFLQKYKLDMAWVDEDLTLYDKKAQIRAQLHFKAIPSGSVPTPVAVEVMTPECLIPQMDSISFQVDSMKAIGKEEEDSVSSEN